MEAVEIDKSNLNQYREQDLSALTFYLTESEDALYDTTPVKIIKKRLRDKRGRFTKRIRKRDSRGRFCK